MKTTPREFADWLGAVLVRLLLPGLVGVLLGQASPFARDDTDPGQGWFDGRSGLRLSVDAATGCQYLSRSGGITPRLDAQGNHRGCKP